jgi:hypothetical protein
MLKQLLPRWTANPCNRARSLSKLQDSAKSLRGHNRMMSVVNVAARDTGIWIHYSGRTAAQREGHDIEEVLATDQGLIHLVEVGKIWC